MEESLYEITSLRQLFQLSLTQGSIPEGKTIMNFRHLLQQHRLAAGILEVTNVHLDERGLSLRQGIIVGATIIHAPSSPKSRKDKSDLEML